MAAADLVVLVRAVGEVEARDVHAAPQHLAQGGHAAADRQAAASMRSPGQSCCSGARNRHHHQCAIACWLHPLAQHSLAACRSQGADDLRRSARKQAQVSQALQPLGSRAQVRAPPPSRGWKASAARAERPAIDKPMPLLCGRPTSSCKRRPMLAAQSRAHRGPPVPLCEL